MQQLRRLLDVEFHRRVFYASNALFWVLGWGSVGVGIWLYTNNNSYAALAPPSYSAISAAGLCICIGTMVLIIAFIGAMGAWIRSRYLLASYCAFVLLLFVVQCTTGTMGYFYNDSVRHRVKYNLYSTINSTHHHPAIEHAWDEMQAEMKCCGVEGASDWFHSARWAPNNQRFVPDTCCDPALLLNNNASSLVGCGKSEANGHLLYRRGCVELYTDWLLHHLYVLGVMALLFGVVEVVVLATSLRLLWDVHRQSKASSGRRRGNNHYEGPTAVSYTSNGGGEGKLILPRIGEEVNMLRGSD